MLLGAVKKPTVSSVALGAIVPQEACQLMITALALNCCVWLVTVLALAGDSERGATVSTAFAVALPAAVAVMVQVPPEGGLLGAVKRAAVLSVELGVMAPQELCQLRMAALALNCCVWPAAVPVVAGNNDSGRMVSTA
jgi:hypothetical protein